MMMQRCTHFSRFIYPYLSLSRILINEKLLAFRLLKDVVRYWKGKCQFIVRIAECVIIVAGTDGRLFYSIAVDCHDEHSDNSRINCG
jgi:hypothetical protein